MKFISTSGNKEGTGFREAVLRGLAPDRGLYFPEAIPALPAEILNEISSMRLEEIAYEVLKPFAAEDLGTQELSSILENTLNFPIPLIRICEDTYTLELFHGPTLAFKDVGARFLARCLGAFATSGQKITVLVATSGDTGSAVGHGFLNVNGVEVKILYPAGKVSRLQEMQLTTLGNNIEAFEVAGTFDDCQRLVKEAFMDQELQEALTLTSANSINVARWLPQSVYYFWACAQLNVQDPPVISVPSGNYGNLAGGLLAKRMGLPVQQFVASSNANNVFPAYLESGHFQPAPSVKTLSNAMDVGDPSNFPRILELYDAVFENVRNDIYGVSCTDEQTIARIEELNSRYGYLPDPHGAVGYHGLQEYRKYHSGKPGIFLETAHPAKFHDTIRDVTGLQVDIPERLQEAMEKDKKSIPLLPSLTELKKNLLK